jgi:hypothetical protein
MRWRGMGLRNLAAHEQQRLEAALRVGRRINGDRELMLATLGVTPSALPFEHGVICRSDDRVECSVPVLIGQLAERPEAVAEASSLSDGVHHLRGDGGQLMTTISHICAPRHRRTPAILALRPAVARHKYVVKRSTIWKCRARHERTSPLSDEVGSTRRSRQLPA